MVSVYHTLVEFVVREDFVKSRREFLRGQPFKFFLESSLLQNRNGSTVQQDATGEDSANVVGG